MKVSINISTLTGRQNLIMTIEEALTTEVAPQVRHLLDLNKSDGAIGAGFSLPAFGKVQIDLVEGQ